MRDLTEHVTDGDAANHQLNIRVTDEPGAGGANHRYVVSGYDRRTNASANMSDLGNDRLSTAVLFQNGPIPDVGVNGVTQEALLAIVIDRLASFQAGPYACEENRAALAAVREGLGHLKRRTLARMARGVEGTHQK